MKKVSKYWEKFCDWLEDKITEPEFENPRKTSERTIEEIRERSLAPDYVAGSPRMKFKGR